MSISADAGVIAAPERFQLPDTLARPAQSLAAPKTIPWVDIARGLGILLVALGHCSVSKALAVIIYAFHMPFFFLISGILYSNRKSFPSFFLDKARRLLLPYLVFSITSFIYWQLGHPGGNEWVSLFWKPLLLGVGSAEWTLINTPLWFLPCLFEASVLFYFISKLNKRLSVGVSILLSLAGIFLGKTVLSLPCHLDVALFCVGFISIGFHFKDRLLYGPASSIPVTIFALALFFGGICFTEKLDLFYRHYTGNIPLMVMLALTGSFILMALAKRIGAPNFLVAIGKSSLGLLCLHGLAFLALTKLIQFLQFVFPIVHSPFRMVGLNTLLYTFGGIFISCLCLGFYARLRYYTSLLLRTGALKQICAHTTGKGQKRF
jgi:acyltransferase